MRTKSKINTVVQRLLDRIRDMPDGSWVSTAKLLSESGYDLNELQDKLLEIHFSLIETAEAENIFLDMSSHEGKLEGLPYNLDFQVFHEEDEEDAIDLGYQPISPIPLFSKYIELIFDNDDLWENFQHFVRHSGPYRGDEFFEYHRDPECIEIWRQMLDNMGGGFPITLFASAAFLLLAYKEQGHDLDAELEALHQRKGEFSK